MDGCTLSQACSRVSLTEWGSRGRWFESSRPDLDPTGDTGDGQRTATTAVVLLLAAPEDGIEAAGRCRGRERTLPTALVSEAS